jgi:HK97 family phage prohead protease
MASEIERRIFRGEIRVVRPGGGPPLIRGYGAVFNVLSENLGGWREKILYGAFADVLDGDTRGLFNHNPDKILGRTPETLRLAEDETGLTYEIDPPDTQYARDLQVSIERGDVDQSSFGFEVEEESWISPSDEEPLPIRVIHKIRKLWDVSPVVFPAYPQTSVAVRSMAETLRSRAAGGDGGMSAAGRLALLKLRLQLAELE